MRRAFIKTCVPLVAGLLISSCSKDDPLPANFLRVNINGANHTFVGRSIYEPREWFSDRDTVENVTYLGGNIGNCFDGNTAFMDVRIPTSRAGAFSLEDGVSFWVQGETFIFRATDNDIENYELTLQIEEYGDMDGRISGHFSGKRLGESSSVISGVFSMKRLPDYSLTTDVIKELCPELYEDYE